MSNLQSGAWCDNKTPNPKPIIIPLYDSLAMEGARVHTAIHGGYKKGG